MRICIPVPPEAKDVATSVGLPIARTLGGSIGVIDNSKPGFSVVARAVIRELERSGTDHRDSLYIVKPTATRAADMAGIDRLAAGAVAVLVGSGD
jgi:hypothetical protein